MRQRSSKVWGALSVGLLFGGCAGELVEPGVSTVELSVDAPVVISQVYGGGGNSGAPYANDFIELFNRSSDPVSLAGWSLQYASATGTGAFGANASQITPLPSVVLLPGQYYLVQQSGGSTGAPLPTADHVDPTPINLAATGGKVALARIAVSLGCNGGATPCSSEALEAIIDLVGYGSANFFEGTGPAPAASNTTAALRLGDGRTDTNDNAADFVALAPLPRNAGFEPPAPRYARIREIQGRAHRSPFEGIEITDVPGVVTAVRGNGFYFEDSEPDDDEATSEGLFVFTSGAPAVEVGDRVEVTGPVSEFRPGGSGGTTNLTITQIARPSRVRVLEKGVALPAPVLLGRFGRRPPTATIDDDSNGSVEGEGSVFDPAEDGIDFYESLEGMRVRIDRPVAVSPTMEFGETSRELVVLVEGGVDASLRTTRGGIVVRADDFNPERVLLANTFVEIPDVSVGARSEGAVTAIVDYSFGNFKFLPLEPLPAFQGGEVERESLSFGESKAEELVVASFNVENLDPTDPPSKFADLAAIIVDRLRSPDLIALEEVQDDNGPLRDDVVQATETAALLIAAIRAIGGPDYHYRDIAPAAHQDGGEPGGNIRVAFLYRRDRGLDFVERPGAGHDTANEIVIEEGAPHLRYSPGRLDPQNAAFASSRKPLAGEFVWNGETLFVVANHFNSKGGDHPLFGRFQPPVLSSEVQRLGQAAVVANFVRDLLAADASAKVVVIGDLNDFEFSPPLRTLVHAGLTPLIETLPPSERYTYVYQGNSQALDHILVSASLRGQLTGFDIVHVNAEFHDQVSDHDPSAARFAIASRGRPVSPVLECVEALGFGYRAYFGTSNPNTFPVLLSVGARNRFHPLPEHRGQPTIFAPGRQRATFAVDFPGGNLVWILNGRTSTASPRSARCR